MEDNKEIKENEEIDNNETNNNIQNNNQDLIPAKSNKALVIGLIILVILLVGGLVYMLFFNKDKEEPKKDNNTPVVTPEPIEDNADKKYELTVYKINDEYVYKYFGEYGKLTTDSKSNDSNTPSFKIPVSTTDAKILAVYNRMYTDKEGPDAARAYVLYNDNGLYIYDAKNKKSEKINLENNYKEYSLYPDEKESKIIGIAYLKENLEKGYSDVYDEIGYYNVLNNKKLYDGKYGVLRPNNLEDRVRGIDDNYIAIDDFKNDKTVLLSRNEEKVALIHDSSYGYFYYGNIDNRIYLASYGDLDYIAGLEIYDKSMKSFYSSKDNTDLKVNFYNNILYVIENNSSYSVGHIKKYDTNGKLIEDIVKDGQIYDIANNYVIYNKNNMLVIQNIDDESETKEIVKLDKKWEISLLLYTDDDPKWENMPFGIYIVVEYDKKDNNGNYGMNYYYEKGKDIVKYPIKVRNDF